MLISMDHDCTPDCPICIPKEDLLKFVKEKKIVPESTPINRALWLLYILYAFLTIATFGESFCVASAIFGQHQSPMASGGLTIGLAERLELIELISKDIHLLLAESAHIMTAKDADISAIDDPNPAGPSPSRDNLDCPPAASSSEKKPDEPAARHPNNYLFNLFMATLNVTWLVVWGYLSAIDSDNTGRDSGLELLGAETDSAYSGQDSGSELLGARTGSDYSGQDSGRGTHSEYSGRETWDSGCGTDSGYSGCGADSDYSGRDSDWETDSDYSGQDSGWRLLGSRTNEEVNEALTEGIRNVASVEGTWNSDEETVTAIQEPVFFQHCVALPKNESSRSQERMTSSSIEAAGFPHEVEININISAQKLASSTLAGFSKSNEGFCDEDNTGSLHSGDDERSVQSEGMEKSVQSEEVDYESRCDEESRAATMVQARYRGHLVRMSRPLVQLREIAGIEARLKRLKKLAGDDDFLDFLRSKSASMVKLAILEETMKLLLRLNNIQGSHPLVRQIRNTVSREIVSL